MTTTYPSEVSVPSRRITTATYPTSDDDVRLWRLVASCHDQPGIVAATARCLFESGANIVHSDQYSTDPAGGRFFLRMEFSLAVGGAEGLRDRFAATVADPFGMTWHLWPPEKRRRVAILVSRHDHCLQELVWRWQRGELDAEIVLVASNWDDLRPTVTSFGLPYHHVPVPAGGKAEAEERLLGLLKGACDLVVLARYMQILSGEFLDRLGLPVINIHHSFLPAFVGANPYEQAKVRGVKLIGATAHYVTTELDAGPIIEQDVVRVGHEHTVAQLVRTGSEIERTVLARAVQWHCEDRVIPFGGTTVVF